ncbi:MAG: GAF domain-containing protein, partial [Bacteroidota bacterium]
LENSQRTQSFIISFIITLVLLSIFISWYLLRNLLNTTSQVSQQIQSFQEGDLPEKLGEAPREIQPLVNQTNQLSDTLIDLKELASQVSAGKFDTRIKVFSEEGKLGKALLSMRESLQNIAIQNRERNWLNEGYAKFSEILRNSANNGEQFYQVVVSNMVRYLDVQQGGIFALNNEVNGQDPFMELKASYAVNRKKYLVRHIKQDVGLIGQVWREKDQVYITDIPEDYADIPTGMSMSRPRSILVSPLITNGQVLGILELISLKELPPYHLDFVQRVSESIATTIARIKVDSETKVLLEESKFMADRMKAQEEEMLQSMEELVATQEKMELNAGEMRTQLQALNENFIMLEMNIQGYITKVNDLALATTGYTEADLLNQHYSIIHGKTPNQDLLLARWDEVMRGHFIKGEFERNRKNGHPFWINEVMYPLYNSQGEIYKVCLVAYDISKQKEQEQKIKDQLNQLYMSKRDVVNRIREVEKKARTEIQRVKLELMDKIKEKEKIIKELKNV